MNKDFSLSNTDISRMFDGKINIYTYEQLSQFDSIDQLLSPYGRVIILYFWDVNPSRGHWCAVFKTPRNTIEFFNSFGTVPDDTLNDIPIGFKKEHGEDFKTLTNLLYESGYDIEYNDKCLQANTSQCCGRYCILRLYCNNLPIQRFQKLFTKNKRKNDQLVIDLIKV